MNKDKRQVAFNKTKLFVSNRKKELRFNVHHNLERDSGLQRDLRILRSWGYHSIQPKQSNLYLERYDDVPPVEISSVSEDDFWNILFSREWRSYSSVRVCEGELLDNLLVALYVLTESGQLQTYKYGRFDTIEKIHKPTLRTDSISKPQVGKTELESVKIKLTYYTQLQTTSGLSESDLQTMSPRHRAHSVVIRSENILDFDETACGDFSSEDIEDAPKGTSQPDTQKISVLADINLDTDTTLGSRIVQNPDPTLQSRIAHRFDRISPVNIIPHQTDTCLQTTVTKAISFHRNSASAPVRSKDHPSFYVIESAKESSNKILNFVVWQDQVEVLESVIDVPLKFLTTLDVNKDEQREDSEKSRETSRLLIPIDSTEHMVTSDCESDEEESHALRGDHFSWIQHIRQKRKSHKQKTKTTVRKEFSNQNKKKIDDNPSVATPTSSPKTITYKRYVSGDNTPTSCWIPQVPASRNYKSPVSIANSSDSISWLTPYPRGRFDSTKLYIPHSVEELRKRLHNKATHRALNLSPTTRLLHQRMLEDFLEDKYLPRLRQKTRIPKQIKLLSGRENEVEKTTDDNNRQDRYIASEIFPSKAINTKVFLLRALEVFCIRKEQVTCSSNHQTITTITFNKNFHCNYGTCN